MITVLRKLSMERRNLRARKLEEALKLARQRTSKRESLLKRPL